MSESSEGESTQQFFDRKKAVSGVKSTSSTPRMAEANLIKLGDELRARSAQKPADRKIPTRLADYDDEAA